VVDRKVIIYNGEYVSSIVVGFKNGDGLVEE
jgi:hypothetical protein